MLRRLLRDFADVRSIRRGDPVPAWQPTRHQRPLPHGAAAGRAGAARDLGRSTPPEPWRSTGSCSTCPSCSRTSSPWHCARRSRARYGGRVVGQSRHYLDEAGRVVLRPDIVWRVGGKVAAVIDAKYKAEKPSGFPNADLYQLLAYCTVLGLRVGHLVYAAGQRAASPPRRPPGGHRDHLPRPESQRATGHAPYAGRPVVFRGRGNLDNFRVSKHPQTVSGTMLLGSLNPSSGSDSNERHGRDLGADWQERD